VRNFGVPSPTEWQRIGKLDQRAFIFARADFVNVHFFVDKMKDSGLKFVGSKLRALSGAERRLLGYRADSVHALG
jgi:hypothetical protein